MDLQNQLMQGSVTSGNAEAAYLDYLEDLRQVARVEIMAIYNQTDATTGANITHIFGRTYSSPHVYFYRNLDNNLNVWSPWQKMDVDIAGDQLIPVVWNNRLYVFWPNYKETADPTSNNSTAPSITTSSGNTTLGSTPSLPTKTLEVTMSWSEYRQGAWTKKQTTPDTNPLLPSLFRIDTQSPGAVFSINYSTTLDATQFSFTAIPNPDDGTLAI
jgi:Neuraminidase-like domain